MQHDDDNPNCQCEDCRFYQADLADLGSAVPGWS